MSQELTENEKKGFPYMRIFATTTFLLFTLGGLGQSPMSFAMILGISLFGGGAAVFWCYIGNHFGVAKPDKKEG